MKEISFFIALLIQIQSIFGQEQQKDSEKIRFLSAQAGIGLCRGIGSSSHNSSAENPAGKLDLGINNYLRAEFIKKQKFGIRIGLDTYNYTVTNAFLKTMIDHKIATQSGVISSSNSSLMVINIVCFSFGTSYYFNFNRFFIQPGIFGDVGFMRSIIDARYSRDPGGLSRNETYYFKAKNQPVLSLIPSLDFKYVVLTTKWMDMAINVGATYSFFSVNTGIYEDPEFLSFSPSSSADRIGSIDGNLSTLNIHVGLAFFFKKRDKSASQ